MLKVYIKGAGYLMYYKIKLEALESNLTSHTCKYQGPLKGPYARSIN